MMPINSQKGIFIFKKRLAGHLRRKERKLKHCNSYIRVCLLSCTIFYLILFMTRNPFKTHPYQGLHMTPPARAASEVIEAVPFWSLCWTSRNRLICWIKCIIQTFQTWWYSAWYIHVAYKILPSTFSLGPNLSSFLGVQESRTSSRLQREQKLTTSPSKNDSQLLEKYVKLRSIALSQSFMHRLCY